MNSKLFFLFTRNALHGIAAKAAYQRKLDTVRLRELPRLVAMDARFELEDLAAHLAMEDLGAAAVLGFQDGVAELWGKRQELERLRRLQSSPLLVALAVGFLAMQNREMLKHWMQYVR